ncbi:MAG: hypothetical protein IH624_08485 [Phycisphaerae bacterium]|nr:hypothetical protein [Phycisphaerae bacterium]
MLRTTIQAEAFCHGQSKRDTAADTYALDSATNRYDLSTGGPYDVTCAYDAAGNTTQDKDSYTYWYDYENRVVKIEDSSEVTVALYDYDALGRRIRMIDKAAVRGAGVWVAFCVGALGPRVRGDDKRRDGVEGDVNGRCLWLRCVGTPWVPAFAGMTKEERRRGGGCGCVGAWCFWLRSV